MAAPRYRPSKCSWEDSAVNDVVEECRTQFVKSEPCVPGPEECETVYDTVQEEKCESKYDTKCETQYEVCLEMFRSSQIRSLIDSINLDTIRRGVQN